MAFMLGAAIGGAAKRASEIFKEEAEAARETVDDAFGVLVELGLPKARKRKELRMAKDKIYDALADEKFSPAQIAAIMRQDKGQATLDHIASMRNQYATYKVNPADIVTMTEDYEGELTKDQILENVMGKMSGGMNISDAITDVTGKRPEGTLTGLFGGSADAVASRRMQAITAATGVSAEELAGYASGEVTRDPALVKGTVSLRDTMAAGPGQITPNSALSRLTAMAVRGFGGKVVTDRDGNVRYEMDITRDEAKAERYGVQALRVFEAKRAEGMSSADALEAAMDHLDTLDYTSSAAVKPEDGTGAGTGGQSVYKGLTPSAIQAQLAKDIENVVGPGRQKSIDQARAALIEALKKQMPHTEAVTKADEIIAGITQ